MNKRLLRKVEVAQFFGVGTRTVERWCAAGRIQRVVVGGTVRFRVEDAEALVRSGLKVGR